MIETDDLARHYGDHIALHPLTIRVAPGEILGFLGPNGAGKSTTVKLLTGMIKPSGGRARVAGFDYRAIHSKPNAASATCRSPRRSTNRSPRASSSTSFCRSITSRRESARQRIDELLDTFGLAECQGQRLPSSQRA